MTNNCSISGVPRNTQTITLKNMRNGANFDIVQNDISSPNGNANIKVRMNSMHESRKPFASWEVTSKKFPIFAVPFFYYLLNASVLIPTEYFSAKVVIVPFLY